MVKFHSAFSGYAADGYGVLKRRQLPSGDLNKPVFDSLYSRHRQLLATSTATRDSYHAQVENLKSILGQKIGMALAHMRKSNRVFQDN
jgi:hypothetical protein